MSRARPITMPGAGGDDAQAQIDTLRAELDKRLPGKRLSQAPVEDTVLTGATNLRDNRINLVARPIIIGSDGITQLGQPFTVGRIKLNKIVAQVIQEIQNAAGTGGTFRDHGHTGTGDGGIIPTWYGDM